MNCVAFHCLDPCLCVSIYNVYAATPHCAIVTLRHKLIYLHATHLNTAAQRRARIIEQAFNCNIWNVREYNARHNVLHCIAFAKCSTEQNNQLAIVRHCSTFAKLSTEQNIEYPIVLLGMQLFYICQMQYRAEQWRTMQSRLFHSVCNCSAFAK